jgi:hypothetical protein
MNGPEWPGPMVVGAVMRWEAAWERPSRGAVVGPSGEVLEGIGGAAQVAIVLLTAPAARRWYNRWGAALAEVTCAMPGDDLVPLPMLASTRAITSGAPPEEVWAWLVQIGQGRGGFYSFDALENLLRWDTHSADQIIPELQQLQAGDLILLAPAEAPCFRAMVEPPHVLVLTSADRRPAPPSPSRPAWVSCHPWRGTPWVVTSRLGACPAAPCMHRLFLSVA